LALGVDEVSNPDLNQTGHAEFGADGVSNLFKNSLSFKEALRPKT
jgi:hypothetical protein